jgi:hypothetical protein
MVHIAVSQAAFEAIAAALSLSRVVYEPLLNAQGEPARPEAFRW